MMSFVIFSRRDAHCLARAFDPCRKSCDRWPVCRYSVRAERVTNPIMIMGCSSDAGKSFLVTALCRHLANRGVRVAPFKAQNMSNNAAVTSDGTEISRAQYLQALAARTTPQARMNPVLLKPSADIESQVIVMG